MMSQSQPTHNGTSQTQPILIIAITLFAFSGLMVGFTVGAFTHNRSSTANTNPTTVNINHMTPTIPPTPTPSPTAIVVLLGCPDLENAPSGPTATPVYNATIQAKDKTGEGANGACAISQEKPVMADGITCRIWLETADNNPNTDLGGDAAQLQHPDTFNQAFPHEIPNALTFDPTTQTETQPCVKGATQWKFTISPSVPKGNYWLVGLTDWQGQHWNWDFLQITVNNNSTPPTTATNNKRQQG